MAEDFKAAGVNPFTMIHDLTSRAALRNIERDSKGEIALSSHIPVREVAA